MPAIAKTSDDQVVRAARKVIERVGADGLSMQAVAAVVGVRAPSLYKRFPDRGAVVDAVAELAIGELRDAVAAADRDARTPATALAAMARAYRAFARRSPRVYGLLFTDRGAHAAPAVDSRATAVAPVLARLEGLVGAQHALSAARLLTSWLHGFVSMELAGAFRLGGDIEAAFDFGLTVLLDGVTHWRST